MSIHKVMFIRDKVWFDKFYTEALASQKVNFQNENFQIKQLHTYCEGTRWAWYTLVQGYKQFILD
jgi:hypothetical protein